MQQSEYYSASRHDWKLPKLWQKSQRSSNYADCVSSARISKGWKVKLFPIIACSESEQKALGTRLYTVQTNAELQ